MQGGIARRSGSDLPPASWTLLEHLDARGAMRVSDIAACHGVGASSVTPGVKALEHTGLVARSTDPADRRTSTTAISPAGRRALDGVHAARAQIPAGAVQGVDGPALQAAAPVVSRAAAALQRGWRRAVRAPGPPPTRQRGRAR